MSTGQIDPFEDILRGVTFPVRRAALIKAVAANGADADVVRTLQNARTDLFHSTGDVASIDVDAKWGGGRSFFSGEGLILLRCTGQGGLLLASYGAILASTLAPGETMTLDTGHVVAFDESVQYSVRKVGNWKSTLLGGEGLVTDFTGPGRVWLQTRSSNDLIGWIKQVNPQRTNS